MLTKLQWIKDNYPLRGWTDEQAKDLCVEMWNEMAEGTFLQKRRSKLTREFYPEANCFACECYMYVCNLCPFAAYAISRNNNTAYCTNKRSPFWMWSTATNADSRRRYAIEIADLFMD